MNNRGFTKEMLDFLETKHKICKIRTEDKLVHFCIDHLMGLRIIIRNAFQFNRKYCYKYNFKPSILNDTNILGFEALPFNFVKKIDTKKFYEFKSIGKYYMNKNTLKPNQCKIKYTISCATIEQIKSDLDVKDKI